MKTVTVLTVTDVKIIRLPDVTAAPAVQKEKFSLWTHVSHLEVDKTYKV